MSSNISTTASILVTAALGIFGMKINDFSPTTIFFYIIGIGIVAFGVSFLVEYCQMALKRNYRNIRFKLKRKNNEVGLGNR